MRQKRTQWPVLGLAIAFAFVGLVPGGWILYWLFLWAAFALDSWVRAGLAFASGIAVLVAMGYGLHRLGERLR